MPSLTREYGSCAPIHAPDPLTDEARSIVAARDHARARANALNAYADCMQNALTALCANDTRNVALWRAAANAALHAYPELQIDWRV